MGMDESGIRFPAAEAEIESWLGNKSSTRAVYEGLLELGLTPYPKTGIKHPRYVRWRDDRRGGRSIYLGPDSMDINKARYGHLVGGLPGAIERSRDVKFMTDAPEGARRALAAARMTIGR